MNNDLDTSDLDTGDFLNVVEKLAGRDAAFQIVRLVGGTTVYIPVSCEADHWLVETVGQNTADIICKLYTVGKTGAKVTVSMGQSLSRRHAIDLLIEGQLSTTAIARRVGLHERTISRLKDKHGRLIAKMRRSS